MVRHSRFVVGKEKSVREAGSLDLLNEAFIPDTHDFGVSRYFFSQKAAREHRCIVNKFDRQLSLAELCFLGCKLVLKPLDQLIVVVFNRAVAPIREE